MSQTIHVTLDGIRPILFDRYPGDNRTRLEPERKMYLDASQGLVIPLFNIYSLLTAQNTRSVAKRGARNEASSRRLIADGILSYVGIRPDNIPLLDEHDRQITWEGAWTDRIKVRTDVARLAGGKPNPVVRPYVVPPWRLRFEMDYVENTDCTLENLRLSLTTGGLIGLGAFRPLFGRFELSEFV